MASILFYIGKDKVVTQEEAIKYIDGSDLSEVFGFSGTEDWVQKLAYYAGEKKFGKATEEVKALVADTKSLTDYYYEKGKLTTDQYNRLKGR